MDVVRDVGFDVLLVWLVSLTPGGPKHIRWPLPLDCILLGCVHHGVWVGPVVARPWRVLCKALLSPLMLAPASPSANKYFQQRPQALEIRPRVAEGRVLLSARV
jgi:hypothetical protein